MPPCLILWDRDGSCLCWNHCVEGIGYFIRNSKLCRTGIHLTAQVFQSGFGDLCMSSLLFMVFKSPLLWKVAPEGMFCPKNLQWSSYITKWHCTPELSKITEATKFFLFVWWNVVKLSDSLEPSFNFCTAVSLEEKKIALFFEKLYLWPGLVASDPLGLK